MYDDDPHTSEYFDYRPECSALWQAHMAGINAMKHQTSRVATWAFLAGIPCGAIWAASVFLFLGFVWRP